MQIVRLNKAAVLTSFVSFFSFSLLAQFPENYPVVWTSQSKNSSASMPCGGGSVRLNVWVEKGDLFFYLSQSNAFDENNTLLKQGRVKVSLSPNPFAGPVFRQELVL